MDQLSLFDLSTDHSLSPAQAPLADRMRPQSLDDYIGQKHLLGPGMLLRQMLEKDMVSSMIFWGPPGSGKTTLARIIANRTSSRFVNFSAVTSGIREIKEIMKQAEETGPTACAPLCLWTRFTDLTKLNRTLSIHIGRAHVRTPVTQCNRVLRGEGE